MDRSLPSPDSPAAYFGSPLLRTHRRRLLVVEDDADLWALIERGARSFDTELHIDWAPNVEAALEQLRSARYDLVLADFLLPDARTGYWLLERSRTLQPEARFALMSSLPLRPPDVGGCPFLTKPFTLGQCRDFLAAALG